MTFNFKYPNNIPWPNKLYTLKPGDIIKGPDNIEYVILQVISSSFQDYPSLVFKSIKDE